MAPAPDVDIKPAEDGRLGATDSTGVDHWTQVANKHWLRTSKSKKVKKDVIKGEIWDVLEKEDFHFSSLLALENLQILESYVYDKTALTTLQIDNYQIPLAFLQRRILELSCPLDRNLRSCQASRESPDMA